MKCNDQAMNFMKIFLELKERKKYFELKLDDVCKKIDIMSRPKPCIPGNADDIPPSNKVTAMVKKEVDELLEKDKRKCNVVISNLEVDRDNASIVNDEIRVMFLVHDDLQAGDIEIVSAVRVTGIQSAMQRHTSRKLIVQLGSLNQKNKLLRLARKLKDSVGHRNVFINPDLAKRDRLEQFRLRSELRERKLNGEEDLVIYNNHIIVRSEMASFLRRGQNNLLLLFIYYYKVLIVCFI